MQELSSFDFLPTQIVKMRNALGLSRSEMPYRNRYIAYSDDWDWNDLVERGFANSDSFDKEEDLFIFSLTQEVAEFIYGKPLTKEEFDEL